MIRSYFMAPSDILTAPTYQPPDDEYRESVENLQKRCLRLITGGGMPQVKVSQGLCFGSCSYSLYRIAHCSSPHCLTASPPERLNASLPKHLTASPPHCSPPERLTVSLPKRLNASLPKHFTPSLLTTSTLHCLSASPLHCSPPQCLAA